ncbi:hypothetical protein JX265_000687 [Neoarthrinium moseri]|uniref:SnoaL-like domain-containing protein n=1 Tax=Neoarthrinium moseri TaxID=1658444 RepID=A0A9P9WZ07_9PEZI|nr:uncharacterized protein JN550_001564 [Neoarthrinium moseri]KAI1854279.1 hypothetical protein JX266_001420 [Neoarthrinium moseri]KAI1876068.1 hypothetical protein JN550_001564 [Neoarthrinium moseri]KAI1881861.1 hypothetical protein JX265_000687 [Neoarthrinium moseri]
MSKRREVALQAIQAYNEWNIDAIMAYRDESCTQEVLPKSLKRPPMDNATYRAAFGSTMPLFKNFTVMIDDVFEDKAGNKVAMWVRSTAETAAGPYRNEYVMMFDFTEDGSKVVRVREFVDSAISKDFFNKLNDKVEETGGTWDAAAWGVGKKAKGKL